MSVKTDANGRRWVQTEVEVPGTPEVVWKAIATSQGISSWFVPSEVDGREGGSIVCHLGPGMDAVAEVTGWDPPRRLTAEGDWGPGVPPVATEWTVEALSGDTCVVRVVHSLFASTDDWDGQLEGTESGWPGFFEILRLYLTHFPGQPCSCIQLTGTAPGPDSEVWPALAAHLGLDKSIAGQTSGSTATGIPAFSGTLESIAPGKAVLRLDSPQPGVSSISTMSMGDSVLVMIRLFLYGEGASEASAREEPSWQAWMAKHYPMG